MALWANHTDAHISETHFSGRDVTSLDRTASQTGAGLVFGQGTTARVRGSVVADFRATSCAGLLAFAGSSVSAHNTSFLNNSALNFLGSNVNLGANAPVGVGGAACAMPSETVASTSDDVQSSAEPVALTMDECRFVGCHAASSGGAVWADLPAAPKSSAYMAGTLLTVTNSTFVNITAGDGSTIRFLGERSFLRTDEGALALVRFGLTRRRTGAVLVPADDRI